MAKQRNIEDAMEKYKGADMGEFFSLKEDKDSDIVRFMIGSKLISEEDWFVVHEFEIEGKKRWVQCTEETDCVGCGSGNSPQVKLFLQLISKSDGKRKVWERGKTFYNKIDGFIKKYGDLSNRPYEIERHGKKGDTKTTYELYPLDRDDKRVEDLPFEKQTLLGKYGEGFVLQLTREEMEDVVDGRFKPESSSNGSSRGNDRNSRNSRDGGRGNDRDRNSSSSRDSNSDRNSSRDRDNGDRDRSDRNSSNDRDSDHDSQSDRNRDRDRDSQDREASRDRDRESADNSRDKDPRDADRNSSDGARKRTGSDVF
jgi:hypothetical protein